MKIQVSRANPRQRPPPVGAPGNSVGGSELRYGHRGQQRQAGAWVADIKAGQHVLAEHSGSHGDHSKPADDGTEPCQQKQHE